MQHKELTENLIGCAMTVHRALGPGFQESVYQNALAHELQKLGFRVACEQRIQVQYDTVIVGNFIADMLVNEMVLIENKAVQVFHLKHEVQVVNYLTATGIDVGLLLNFGADSLGFKRKYRRFHMMKD
ncbi:MAG: GxxExxY protein [Flavobacteriales bacterium]|nr:GxxExxY protein [Flavobacteriales bacterium]MBK6943202.1 GxxExxY protein [Flavobacteriales bacterium]MBK7240915.1 GxxExxY protein [Flavobacteriales bacterium]MBK9536267.1 GxxExxY protein [Flavobacteriales bacterium]